MTLSSQSARKREGHEKAIRGVVDFAHEVRIHLQDAQVIFGSVTPAVKGEIRSFRIRPWGLSASIAIQFDDVALAAPVKQMGWERHRAIAAAQHAGIFTGTKSVPTAVLLEPVALLDPAVLLEPSMVEKVDLLDPNLGEKTG